MTKDSFPCAHSDCKNRILEVEPSFRIDVVATPASVAPRPIPSGLICHFGWHRIVSRSAARPTTLKASQPHPRTRPQAEAADRLLGVFRARRQIAALPPHKGGQCHPVKPDQKHAGPGRQTRQGFANSCRDFHGTRQLNSFPRKVATANPHRQRGKIPITQR